MSLYLDIDLQRQILDFVSHFHLYHTTDLLNVGNMPNISTDRDQIWHTYAYSFGNGHELNKNNPLIPEGHGVVRGSSIHKSGKASKPLELSGPNLAHVYRFTRELT